MNKHLDKAIFGIGKVDALMHSIEQLYLDFEVMPEEQERLNRGTYAFYVLWDEIREVADELDLLSGDCRAGGFPGPFFLPRVKSLLTNPI